MGVTVNSRRDSLKYTILLDITDDELSPQEDGFLYSMIWGFCEDHCMAVRRVDIKKVKEDE
jgi:hypothetical protein